MRYYSTNRLGGHADNAEVHIGDARAGMMQKSMGTLGTWVGGANLLDLVGEIRMTPVSTCFW